MHLTTTTITTLAALAAVTITATAATTPPANIGLSVNSTEFDINYLQTLRLSYANSSAYIGEIKYQTYSEPLVTSNPAAAASDDSSSSSSGLSFQSIHSSPTGWQQVYVVPDQSQPVWLSVPHGGPPGGVTTTGFGFGSDGGLQINGENLFYACQDAGLAAMNTYQIYWLAAGSPSTGGVTCKGPIQILASDACARY